MSNQNEYLDSLKEIRSIMERSSQFLSLSGLSGIFAGLSALIGAFLVYVYKHDFFFGRYYKGGVYNSGNLLQGSELSDFILFLLVVGISVLVSALFFGVFFTTRNARRKGLSYWNNTAKRMLINLFIPLVAGGLFCVVLLYHGVVYLIAPATLVFYGLALINASKYTIRDVRYLGIFEVILGLLSAFIVGYSLLFWAFGFGVLHIVYGLAMYFKYERADS